MISLHLTSTYFQVHIWKKRYTMDIKLPREADGTELLYDLLSSSTDLYPWKICLTITRASPYPFWESLSSTVVFVGLLLVEEASLCDIVAQVSLILPPVCSTLFFQKKIFLKVGGPLNINLRGPEVQKEGENGKRIRRS